MPEMDEHLEALYEERHEFVDNSEYGDVDLDDDYDDDEDDYED